MIPRILDSDNDLLRSKRQSSSDQLILRSSYSDDDLPRLKYHKGSLLDSPRDVVLLLQDKPSDGASGSHVLAGAGVPECTNLTEAKVSGSLEGV